MANKKNDPKAEWGFYSMTPRIVRTQYKQLSHTEKWLYVCLKDLCGDRGMCYRSLRALSQETDLSTGNLSTGIRKLHDAGLIHAEKKRRNNNPTQKEVWHISIVDIWQSNVEYCSKYEQPTQDNVQDLNNNVQNMNEPEPERSENEQKRSNFDDRRINNKNNNTEERTIEEDMSLSSESDAPAASITDLQEWKTESAKLRAISKDEIASHSQMDIRNHDDEATQARMPAIKADQFDTGSSPTPNDPAQRSGNVPAGSLTSAGAVQRDKKRKKVQESKPAFTLSAQEQAFWLLWCNLWFNAGIPLVVNDLAYKHIKTLAPHVTTMEQMNSLEQYTRKRLKESGMSRKELHLGNCVNVLPQWKQTQQKPQATPGKIGDYYILSEAM